MFSVGDNVVISRYQKPMLGIIMYVKGFDIDRKFYIVEADDGSIDSYKEDELFLDK